MKHFIPAILLLIFQSPLHAQMWNGQDTLYGNEWINYEQTYYKIPVAEDGIYRISYATLRAAGLPVEENNARRYQLFHLGQEVPLYTPANPNTPLQTGDYLEFYGEQNRAELDRFLFQNPEEEMLNPFYSMFTDTAAYFLTVGAPGEEDGFGKRYREVENELDNLPEQEAWYWDTLQLNFSTNHYNKKYAEDLVAYSEFDEGEGFASPLQQTHQFSIQPENVATVPGQGGKLSIRLFAERGDHDLQITINNREVHRDSTLRSYTLQLFEFDISADELTGPLDLQITGLNGRNDRYAVANGILEYPATFSFPGSAFISFPLAARSTSRYIQLNDLPDTLSSLSLYDPDNQIRLELEVDGGVGDLVWPVALEESYPVAGINSFSVGVGQIKEVVFRDYQEENAEYLMLTHSRLSEGTGSQVKAYVDYRSSSEGGGFRTIAVDVEELYDQFGYGIAQHSQALRNFGFYVKRNWDDLQYILLLGHGVDYAYVRDDPRRNENLVPTMGNPGSDHLLFAPIGSSVSFAAVGRLAAETPQEIEAYLNKIKEHEAGLNGPLTFKNQAWRKRILHLVGGNNKEKPIFELQMDNAGMRLENNSYGADLFTVARTSSDPVSTSIAQEVINAINNGVGIKSFLGHGGVTTTDFGLDDPALINNRGKYPLIFSLGCLTGYTSDFQESLSEQFVFAPRRGGIAYIASVGFASPGPLTSTTGNFYQLLGGAMYGQGIGKILNEARKKYDDNQSTYFRSLMQQMSLHGDPAVKVNRVSDPDFLIDYSSLSFTPAIASTNTDSMEVEFTLANIGGVDRDSVIIQYRHINPGGAEFLFRDTVLISTSFQEARFRFPIDGRNSKGINRLEIELDPENTIQEGPAPAAEQNNRLSSPGGTESITFFVTDKSVEPVYPEPFGIVGEDDLTLQAAPADIFAKGITYILEVDTTALFNSPAKYSRQIEHTGGLLEHQPNIDWEDGRVYYWRVSLDSISNPEISIPGTIASFLYQGGSQPGWNQSHYFQFSENEFDGIQPRERERSFPYAEVLTNVTAFAEIFSREENDVTSRIFLNNWRVVRNWPPPSLGILVLNSVTGAIDSRGVFRLDRDEKRREAIAFLQSIPESFYVFLVTFRIKNGSYGLENWMTDSTAVGTTLYGVLEAEGAGLIRDLASSGEAPYALAYQKGQGVMGEKLGEPGEFSINIFLEIPSLLSEGSMTTPLIGPAKDWGTVEWKALSDELMDKDSLSVNLYGSASPKAAPTLLWSGTQESLPIDFVDPGQYPYLQLQFYSLDTVNRTAPQVDYWRVRYQQIGDLVFDPVSFHQDTIQRGDVMRLDYNIHNFSSEQSDSVLVRFTIKDPANETVTFENKLPPVPSYGAVAGQFALDTRAFELEGDYQLTVEANPESQVSERKVLNNIGVKPFYLQLDQRNPLLDVTFDGRHIMDGELVSARPYIVISLQDENPFLLLQDTSLFTITLEYPGGRSRRLYFQEEELVFIPAEPEKSNRARVEFSPELLENGTYELNVNSRDEQGNQAGSYEFTVSFEVDNRQLISNVLPYPNPFSTSTRFAYTMTGAEEPAFFMIQIMTVSGRIVREITKEEFGLLRVGTHLSDFVWNGTDEFGDPLANGIYLYRVIVKDELGEDYEHYENATDRFFKKNFGKIVILR